MLAVLQMFNLYEKQLKKAQSLRRKVLPWRDGITHSSESEIVPHSLNLKEKWKPTGLLRRLMNEKPILKSSKSTEEDSDQAEISKDVRKDLGDMYSTKFVDDSDSDSDFSPDKPSTAKKAKNKFKLLRKTVAAGLQKSGNLKGKPTLTLSNGHLSAAGAETDDNLEIIPGKENSKNKVQSEQKISRETSILSGVKAGLSKMFMSAKKRSRKEEQTSINIKDGENEEADQIDKDEYKIPEDIPTVPRKKQKKEETTFSCPLCEGLFSEGEINDHAFTCDGTKPHALRSNESQVDHSMDFIPLSVESGSAFFKAQSTAGKAAESGDYSKWETACRKVDMGLRKNNVATSQLPTEKKETPLMGYKKETTAKQTVIKPSASRQSKHHWISDDDSDSDDKNNTQHILDQYIIPKKGVEKKKENQSRVIEPKLRRKREYLDEDDSDGGGEKCYICGRRFQDGVGYNTHVTECMLAAEKKANFTIDERETKTTEISSKNGKEHKKAIGLHQRLGNRKSWAPFDKAAKNEERQPKETISDDDSPSKEESPIKTFTPIGEASVFDFDNQFKNSSIPKRKRTNLNMKTYRKKNRK